MLAKSDTEFFWGFFGIFVFWLTYGISNKYKELLFPFCDIYTKIFVQAKKPGTFLCEQTGKA